MTESVNNVLKVFSQWLRQTPDAIAVTDREQSYSYKQLEATSSRIASALKKQGVGKGDVVAVYFPRSVKIWPVILGVFKVGAVYLPLETEWPDDRFCYVLAKANCRHLICMDLDVLPAVLTACKAYSYQELTAPPSLLSDDLVVRHSTAYIIFTSGSTGRPKGVEISHSALLNLLLGMAANLNFDQSNRLLCITSFAFDLVMPDLFLPLVTGGCGVLAPTSLATDARGLAVVLRENKISLLQATPHCYRCLLDLGWEGSSQLKLVVGGDKVSRDLADSLVTRVAELWHCYGPTETTVWASMGRHKKGALLNLNQALPGYRLIALTEKGEVLDKPGELGELYIGGKGLSLGYINDKKKTEECFLELFIGSTVGRFYKTGDRVRLAPDGQQMEFIGRVDNQVKLRGYRVELGEVERVACSVEGVREFVAVQSGDAIIAYYSGNGLPDLELERAIRERCEQRLPWYMLPAKLYRRSQLPLNTNKKVDRAALAVEQSSDVSVAEAEDCKIKQAVRRCWQAQFAGWTNDSDNFFDLGGDSLCAVNLLVQLEKHLSLHLPLSLVYAFPTVSLMSTELSSRSELVLADKKYSAEVLCLQHGQGVPLYCFHPVGGGVYHYQLLAEYLDDGQLLYGIQAQGFDGDKPLYSIESMAKSYCKQIMSLSPGESVRLVGGSMGGVLALETAKLLVEKGVEVQKVFLLDTVADTAGDERPGKPISLSKILNTIFSRLGDYVLAACAKWTFLRGQRLSNKQRYKYMHLVNHRSLVKYFSSAAFRKPYQGDVILLRQPLQQYGTYSDPVLGWRGGLGKRLELLYIDASHEKFIEAPEFREVFRSTFYS
jgi:amino acid adenylation domain-containing protein